MWLVRLLAFILGLMVGVFSIPIELPYLSAVVIAPFVFVLLASHSERTPTAQLVGGTLAAFAPIFAIEVWAICQLDLSRRWQRREFYSVLMLMPYIALTATAAGAFVGQLWHWWAIDAERRNEV